MERLRNEGGPSRRPRKGEHAPSTPILYILNITVRCSCSFSVFDDKSAEHTSRLTCIDYHQRRLTELSELDESRLFACTPTYIPPTLSAPALPSPLDLRADSYAEENSRLRLAIEKQEEEQQQRDQERHDREVQHENETRSRNLQSKSLKARLCRTLDELREAEEAGELAMTCLECAKLFKDPHVMAPCGHTMCADCSRRGDDAGLALGQSAEESSSSGWVLGGGGGDSTARVKRICPLCVKQGRGGGAAEESSCVGSAPSRELATLVAKFAFRRQLLESLREIAALLWQDDLRRASGGALPKSQA